MQYIYTYDLSGLRELWGHLDQKMFSKLENEFTSGKKILDLNYSKDFLKLEYLD